MGTPLKKKQSPRTTRGDCPVPVATRGYPGFVETALPTWSRNHPQSSGVPVRCTVTLSSILAWRIPWTEEPGRLQSIGSQQVEQDWSNWAHTQHILGESVFLGAFVKVSSFIPSHTTAGGRNCNQLQYPYLENPIDKGAWQATVHRVAKSWTWLKRLSRHAWNPGALFLNNRSPFRVDHNAL